MTSMVVLLCLITGTSTTTVTQSPQFLNLSAGDTAQMFCDVKNISDGEKITYFWQTEGSQDKLLNSSRLTVTPNSLTISCITPNDTRRYICSVRDKYLRLYSGNGTNLTVKGSNTSACSGSNNLYSLILLLLLLPLLGALILYWRCARRRRGSQSSHTEERNGQMNIQKKDEGDLNYAAILHRPAGGQNKEKKERNPKTRMNEKRDDGDANYAAILHRSANGQNEKRKKEERNAKMRMDEKRDDGDVMYAAILNRPASGQNEKKKKEERNPKMRMDEVEYAPVRMAAPDHPTDPDPGNVCYASLRKTRPPEQSATSQGTI